MEVLIFLFNITLFNRNRIPVKDPKSITENELCVIAQAVIEEESKEEVGGEADTSEDEVIEENDHFTDSEEEPSDLEEEPDHPSTELFNRYCRYHKLRPYIARYRLGFSPLSPLFF